MSLFLNLMKSGGWVMYPLLLCSLVALGLVIERFWALRRSRIIPLTFLISANNLLEKRRFDEMAFLCQDNDTSAARLVNAGLKLGGRPRELFKDGMEDAGRKEAGLLTARLGALYLIATISPLLGLLGTVTGMINAFHSIAADGAGNPGLLAGGISEALLTTATGLCIAIPVLVLHRALFSRAHNFISDLEDLSSDLLEALSSHGK